MTTEQLEGPAELVARWRERPGESHEVLARFTDEELAALADPAEGQVAPAIWLDRQAPEERGLALSIALRGLIARGVVQEVEQDPATETLRLSLSVETQALFAMRRAVSGVVISERQDDTGKFALLLYFGDGPGILAETVDQQGIHTFSVCAEDLALEALTGLCDPYGVAGSTSGVPEIVPEYTVPATLDLAQSVTVVATVHRGPWPGSEPRQDRAAFYAFADHLKVSQRLPGATDLTVRRIGSDDLRATMATLTGTGLS